MSAIVLDPVKMIPCLIYFNASKWSPTSPPAILIICWVEQRLLRHNVNTPNIKCNFSGETEQCVTSEFLLQRGLPISSLQWNYTCYFVSHPLFIQIIPTCAYPAYYVLPSLFSPSPWTVNFTTKVILPFLFGVFNHTNISITGSKTSDCFCLFMHSSFLEQCLAHCRKLSNICWKNECFCITYIWWICRKYFLHYDLFN